MVTIPPEKGHGWPKDGHGWNISSLKLDIYIIAWFLPVAVAFKSSIFIFTAIQPHHTQANHTNKMRKMASIV